MSETHTSIPPHAHTGDHTRNAASARRNTETLKQPLILPQYNLYLYLHKGTFLNIMLIRMHCLPNPCPSGLLDPPPPPSHPLVPPFPSSSQCICRAQDLHPSIISSYLMISPRQPCSENVLILFPWKTSDALGRSEIS